jgi:hypothetical protein
MERIMKIRKALFFGAVFVGATQFAAAQAVGLAEFFGQTYVQTGSSSTSFAGYYAADRVDMSGPSDPTDVEVTRPNGTVDTLVFNSTPQFLYQTGYYSSLSAFNADFGLGTYTFSGDSGTLSGTVQNNSVLWASTPPTVTNYSALQNADPTADLDVDFTPFSADANANYAATYIGLFDVTTNTEIEGGVFDPATTSFDILSSYLAPNQTYQLTIDDDNRLVQPAALGFEGATPYASYDVNTLVNFNTTPEPAPIAMIAIGVLGLCVRRRTSK